MLPAHVHCFIINEDTHEETEVEFTLTNSYTVTLSAPVPAGSKLRIRRITPKNSPMVDYNGGSVVSEANLDKANIQSVLAAAEAMDEARLVDWRFDNEGQGPKGDKGDQGPPGFLTPDQPRKLSYGPRYRIRTTRQAVALAETIHLQIVGHAAGVTGGLGQELYLVDNTSTDPEKEGSWPHALAQATANDGGMIVFVPHGQLDIPIAHDQPIYDNVTVIAPGGNVTFWCTTADGGFTPRGTNTILAYLQFRTLPGLLAGLEADGVTKIEQKLTSVDPVGADMVAFIGCEFRRASDGALDMSSSAFTADDGQCRVTVQNCIFWDTDQVMLLGGTGYGSDLTDDELLKVTLYNNIFAYCGERIPKLARLTTVDMVDCYTILFPFQRDQIEEAVNEFSACYGASASSGSKLQARGCFWWCPPGFEVGAGVLGQVADGAGSVGAANAIDCAAEGTGASIIPANIGDIPALPYTLAHTPVPAGGAVREAWIADRWLTAGARRDAAPEGEFVWTANTTPYPNGETVLVDRVLGGRWLRVDTQAEFIADGERDLPAGDPVLDLPRGSTLTIAGGVVTIDADNSTMAVATEGAAATDDLVTINGGTNGRVIILRASSSAFTITLKAGGNIDISQDVVITRGRAAVLLWDSTIWTVVSGKNLVTKADVGLGNVNNTADADKPISTDTATALAGKAAVAHTHTMADITNLPTLASGSFTPALTAVSNCSALSVNRASYMQIGKRVHVSIVIAGTLTTTAVSTAIGIALPVARDFTVTSDVQGECRAVSSTNQVGGYVTADATNDRAQMTLTPTTATGAAFTVSASFSYMLP